MNDVLALSESSPADIWLLLDDRAGNRNQCLGVAEALKLPFEHRDIEYNALGALPNGMTGASFLGLSRATKENLMPPWPRLVIAAGRRTAGAARAIKRMSKGTTKIVQIMHPGQAGIREFDLVAVPSHDTVMGGPNLLTVQGAPHSITAEVLMSAKDKWSEEFETLPGPRIAVFVGGDTRRKEFDSSMAREFGQAVNTMAVESGGSLLISTSRRTSVVSADAFLSQVSAPHVLYRWGNTDENPYVGYLACADATVVGGDSVSMASEACAGTKPVYIYAPPGFVMDKHARMHKALFEGGYARPFGEPYSEWFHAPLNAATEIAAAIHGRLGIG